VNSSIVRQRISSLVTVERLTRAIELYDFSTRALIDGLDEVLSLHE
jgi:hypothetical protein